jgi:hypothetical protein
MGVSVGETGSGVGVSGVIYNTEKIAVMVRSGVENSGSGVLWPGRLQARRLKASAINANRSFAFVDITSPPYMTIITCHTP